MERLLANWYLYIYDSMYTQSKTYDTLTSYSNAVIGTLSSSGVMHDAYLVMRTIAFGILTVYFIITFGSRMEGRETSPAMVFKTLLEYFVGYALALFSFDIVKWLFEFGDWMGSLISEALIAGKASTVPFDEAFEAGLSHFDFTAQVMYAFKALLPYLACIIANIIITYAIVSRVIRICVNAALSPIAISNFFDDTRRTDGMRFIKKTLSMCLQCSAIVLISVTTTNLSTFMSSNTIYGDAMEDTQTITEARQAMVNSLDINYGKIGDDVEYAEEKLGASLYDESSLVKEEYFQAQKHLTGDISEVKEEDEDEYKAYEKSFDMEIFKRTEDGKHYIYDKDGNAEIKDTYKAFTAETVQNFMDTMLMGNNWLVCIMLLAIKVGLIKQSNSLCNVIVGL